MYFDSYLCVNNRGWCRESCFFYEYIDWVNMFGVCGLYFCCRFY